MPTKRFGIVEIQVKMVNKKLPCLHFKLTKTYSNG